MNFNELRKIDVSERIEKKQSVLLVVGLCGEQVAAKGLRDATWDYRFFDYDLDRFRTADWPVVHGVLYGQCLR